MSIVFDDEFHGVGGAYEIRDGKRVPVEQMPAPAAEAKPAAPAETANANIGRKNPRAE